MISNLKSFASKAYSLSLNKQFVFFASIAFMIVLLMFSFEWIKTPQYSPLFSSLSSHDEKNALKILEANSIHYKLSPSSGMILVSDAKVNRARMIMAQNGLPSTTQDSYSLLMKNEGIYTSQTNEDIIKRKILEENIQTAIETINGIQAAKVELALPHHTDFMQKIIHPKASIVLRLDPGVVLTSDQVQGISYLVSSSIPYMKPNEVTIVDQTGALLSGSEVSPFSLSSDQLKYKQEIENKLTQQILNVLAPIVGRDNIHVQVNANLDFNARENTTKAYQPSKRSVESEQIEKSEEKNNAQTAQGVPGALSNQPPKSGKLNDQKSTGGGGGGGGGSGNLESSNDRETYNFSLGESITHTSFAKGEIRNLSVAIVLNDKKVAVMKPADAGNKKNEKKESKVAEKKVEEYQPIKPEEITKLTSLAKDAIGFDETRGDRISVINERFAINQIDSPKRFTIPLYQQAWFLEILKGILFLIGFVIFVLFIWKPFFNRLFSPSDKSLVSYDHSAGSSESASQQSVYNNAGATETVAVKTPSTDLEATISETKAVFQNSPDVAAGVIRRWVRSSDANLTE